MSDEKPERIPAFPTEDERSVPYHIAMGTLDAAASLVPGASYGVQQIVRQFIGEPLERRRETWFVAVGDGLREMQDRLDGFDPTNLAGDEEFLSAVAEASRIAMTTHRAEKLEALRNVVLNAAVGMYPDEAFYKTFLAYVDRFSTLHLHFLRFLANPKIDIYQNLMKVIDIYINNSEKNEFNKPNTPGWKRMNIDGYLPDRREGEDLLRRIISELEREGLIRSVKLDDIMREGIIKSEYTTKFGNAFLDFISDPTLNVVRDYR